MIDFGKNQPEAELMRAVTDDVLVQQPLPDDNRLLEALQQAHYLETDTCIGYAAAVLYFTRAGGEDDRAAELFVGRPLGEAGLVSSEEANTNYRSMHFGLRALYKTLPVGFGAESGTVTDCHDGSRLFVPSDEPAAWAQIMRGQFADADALRSEFERLGVDDIGYSRPWLNRFYQNNPTFDFVDALREAAKWVSYTLEPPYYRVAQEQYPRTLTFEEATICLAGALTGIAQDFALHDIDIVHDVIGLR